MVTLAGRLHRGLPGALIGLTAACALTVPPLAAQERSADAPSFEVFVNGEMENYLRLLQSVGAVAPYPWSIRSFAPHEVERLRPAGDHPWAGRYDLVRRDTPGTPDTSAARAGRGVEWGWVRPTTQVIYNSAFPHGFNDGPVWAGRGTTLAYQMGVGGRFGPLSVTLAPQVFWAQNAAFELMPNDQGGRLAYADARQFADGLWPYRIDLPQRFGDEPYARIDPGQSTVRLDLAGVAAGVSTANQHWGPAAEQPIVLGSNAPGFLHGFLGTSAPVNLWVGRLHGRLVWGRLEHTAYAPIEFAHADIEGIARFSSGFVLTFSPRGVPGLELGASRFFHDDWPSGGPSTRHFLKPLQSIFKVALASEGDDGSDPADNQIASVFARWVFPRSGLEAYGEFGRYDHSWDLRDFLLEPDHDSAYLLGVRKALQPWPGRLLAVRGELMNTRIGHIHRVRTPQVPFYVHSGMPQGHTHRGQLLGAPAGFGGGGSLLAVDYLHPGGRVTGAWRREIRQERGHYWWYRTPEWLEPEALDVIHSLGAEALVFRGRWEVTAGVAGAYNLNRNYGSDVFNLTATLQVRAGL